MAGDIGWLDITVEDAEGLRDFYAAVVGWTPGAVDMGEYSDFTMSDSGGTARAGVRDARFWPLLSLGVRLLVMSIRSGSGTPPEDSAIRLPLLYRLVRRSASVF